MSKILVNAPDGQQRIIDIKPTGKYYDPSRVIWDERTDGAKPAVTLGKMQRSGDQLITLDDYIPAHLTSVLSKSKAEKRAELNAAYESALYADIDYAGETYAATSDRQELLSNILSVGSVPSGMYWKDAGGVQHPMTFSDLQGLGSAILARGLTANANLNTKLAAVDAAVTQAEVDAIQW